MSLLHVPLTKPGLGVWDDAMPLLSPYQTNPLSMAPLRYVLCIGRRRGSLEEPCLRTDDVSGSMGACSEWLEDNRAALGVHSSVDIGTRYLGPYRQAKVPLSGTEVA